MADSNTLNQHLLNSSSSLGEVKEESFEKKEKLSVDQALDRYVGGFGTAQLLHVMLVSLAWAFEAMHTLVAIFSDAQPAWHCVKSAAESHQCTAQSSICEMERNLWEWVDGSEASVVSEWSLFCHDKFKAGIPASLLFLGCILGAGVFGVLADTCLGRKRTLILSCSIMSVSGFLTALSPNLWIYSTLRFITGFGRAGVGICSLVLSTEAVGQKWRGQVGLYGFLFFTAGFASLPAIAYITRSSWRTTYLAISALSMAYTCILLPFAWESPKWLILRKREADAIKILKKMAVWNSRLFPENISITLDHDRNRAKSFTSILTVPWARRRMVVLMVVGVCTGLVYYGMPLNIGNLNFNPYVNTCLNALMELPAIALGTFLLPRVDRRVLVSVFSGVYCVCCVVCSFVNSGWIEMVVELVGFMAACATFDISYVFCLELFSTDVRSVAVAMLRQAVMLGAAISPSIVVVGRTSSYILFMVFGGIGILSTVVTLLLPETRNHPTYETLEEQGEEEEERGSEEGKGKPLLLA